MTAPTPEASQLELDLLSNACDRLQLWVDDTKMRCEVADIDFATPYIIMYALLKTYTVLAVRSKVPRDEFANIILYAYDDYKKKFLKSQGEA